MTHNYGLFMLLFYYISKENEIYFLFTICCNTFNVPYIYSLWSPFSSLYKSIEVFTLGAFYFWKMFFIFEKIKMIIIILN